MATLQEAIDEVQDQVGAISGIREAPDEPPDQMNVFPFAVAYAWSGEYDILTRGLMRGLHTLVVELHVARKDLERDTQRAMVYAKSIPNAIFNNLGGYTAFATLSHIRYEFGPLGWGGADTLGFRFFLEGVKTEDTLS